MSRQHGLKTNLLGRNESEVILDPKYLTDITQVQDLQQSLDIQEQTM